ncbi:MAG: tripartite tricarboxylate transporter substrate binding protein [Alphaproteobacteria bacterium]|nr:tripartite tricarboxylate transporter substrate binding protein [Alphaproteobacteria bacterium]
MISVRCISLVLLALATVQGTAHAQDNYPNRPIRVITSQGTGGLSDVWMRAVVEQVGSILGGTVVVENRSGAAGTIGARACSDAAPDGYTFCMISTEAMVINPVINPVPGFDPMKRLAPVTKAFYLQQVFALTAQINVKSFDELAALAKAKPKTLAYMSASLTKTAFIEDFNRKHGIDLVRVPFKGGGDAINAMLTNTTQIAVFGIGNLIQLIRDGKIHGLAVDGEKRSALAPDIPTFKEAGHTRHLAPTFFGIYAPAGTPRPLIDRFQAAVAKVAGDPEFQKRHMSSRGLTAVLNTPDRFAVELERERVEALEAIKSSGLYPNIK